MAFRPALLAYLAKHRIEVLLKDVVAVSTKRSFTQLASPPSGLASLGTNNRRQTFKFDFAQQSPGPNVDIRCSYAKKAAKLKNQAWKGSSNVTIADGILDLPKLEAQMSTSEAKFEEFVAKNNPRISPGMLDEIKVRLSDGTVSPLYHVAQVSLKGQQFHVNVMLTEPADAAKSIVKAIESSGMGSNPTVSDNVIRVNIPRHTQEYRDSIAKKIKSEVETAKVALRKWRRQGMDEMKRKKSDVAEDSRKAIEKQIEAMTEYYVVRVENIADKRMKELKN